MRKLLLVLVILFIALFLRLYRVTEVPPSLNWDEVSIGYNAYSILKTGRDEWGRFLPLHFKSYGEYKLPAQIYASIPAIAIFGLNDFAIRITPVIYGTITVLLLYFLARDLFKNRWIGLISAFLLAISPWHIQLTRASFESSFSVFWIVLGLWLFIKGFEKSKWWVISMIPFTISIYTYNSARVFTPLLILTLFLIFKKEILKHSKETILSFLIFVVLLLPLVPFVLSGEATARYKLVSITNDPGLIPRINERRGMSKLPAPLPRLIHNRVTYVSYYFAKNYLAHFTPAFLFITGAGHRQHHVQGMGELYYFQAPFLLLGLYLIFRKKEKFKWLLISWLLIAFIPVSATNDSIPNALRTLIAAPVYQILIAYGIYYSIIYFGNKRLLKIGLGTAVFIFGLVQFALYLKNYYQIYPILYSRDWQYGNKEVVSYIKEHYEDYDLIVYTREYGEPHMFTLFYLNYSPDKYQNNPNLDRFETNDWVWVLKFDKFYFPNLSDSWTSYKTIVDENSKKRILFIGQPQDFGSDVISLKKINFLNGESAFEIVEVE